MNLMELYYQSQPAERGFRKRLHTLWQGKGFPAATEQKLSGQVNSILNNRLLPQEELDRISGSTRSQGTSRRGQRTQSQRRSQHFPDEEDPDYEEENQQPDNQSLSLVTAKPKRMRWTNEDNTTLMELYYRSNPSGPGYRKRLHAMWNNEDLPTIKEGRLADQARAIRENAYLSDVELMEIRDRVDNLEQRLTSTTGQRPQEGGDTTIQRRTTTPTLEEETTLTCHPDQQDDAPDDVRIGEWPDTQTSHPDQQDDVPDDVSIGEWPDTQPPSPTEENEDYHTGQRAEEEGEEEPEHRETASTPPALSEMINYLRRVEAEESGVTPPDFNLTEKQLEYRAKLIALLSTPDKIETKILRHVNRKQLAVHTEAINAVVKTIPTPNITETNTLLRAAAHVVREALGEKMYPITEGTKKKEPKWKRRIEGKIKQDRTDISQLEEMKKGTKLKTKTTDGLYRRHPLLKKKGLPCIIEELKQRLMAKAHKIKRYTKRIANFQQNKLFKNNQRQFYRNLNANPSETGSNPLTAEDKANHLNFWKSIWEDPVEHNNEAPWLGDVKDDLRTTEEQEPLKIDATTVTGRAKKMTNWSAAGTDGLHVYWLKHLTATHERIASQMMNCVESETIPGWMTEGRTHLLIKDPTKGNTPGNFRPITCLPAMWKLLTGIVADDIYAHLDDQNLLPNEQKGCKKMSRGCKEQLLIDKLILKNCKRRKTDLQMCFIDYKKAYDKIPHSWIIESMKICGVAPNIISLFQVSLTQSKVELKMGQSSLGNVIIKRGIFQGDSVSPLQFVMGLIPLSILLRKMPEGYVLKQGGPKISHRLYMDDLKLYAKSPEELHNLIDTTRIFSEDICMEFGIEKCATVKIEKGVKVESEGVTMPDGKVLKDLGDDGYRYLGILESDKILHAEMKEQTSKEYLRRLKKILKSGLNGKHCIEATNTWAIPVMRYGAGIINWGLGELRKLDIKTRKLMKLHRAHHPQGDVDRLYVSRKLGGRGLQNIEEVVCREQNAMTTYFTRSPDPELIGLIEHLKKENLMKGEVIDKLVDKQKDEENHQKRWKDKAMHGQYLRSLEDIADPTNTWNWLHQQDLKKETEGLIIAAQDQALRTNMIKFKIDKTSPSPLCRLCRKKGETVDHILSGCEKLAQSEYKKRHDKVAAAVHWCMCRKHHIQCNDKWYQHRAEKVSETDDVKILWDFMVQNDHMIEARRPDIILIEKKKRKALIIDIAVPGDTRIQLREDEKILKYQDLKREIKQVWNLTSVKVVPIVVGALGAVTPSFQKHLDDVDCHLSISSLQKTALLGSARILRMVLDI